MGNTRQSALGEPAVGPSLLWPASILAALAQSRGPACKSPGRQPALPPPGCNDECTALTRRPARTKLAQRRCRGVALGGGYIFYRPKNFEYFRLLLFFLRSTLPATGRTQPLFVNGATGRKRPYTASELQSKQSKYDYHKVVGKLPLYRFPGIDAHSLGRLDLPKRCART